MNITPNVGITNVPTNTETNLDLNLDANNQEIFNSEINSGKLDQDNVDASEFNANLLEQQKLDPQTQDYVELVVANSFASIAMGMQDNGVKEATPGTSSNNLIQERQQEKDQKGGHA